MENAAESALPAQPPRDRLAEWPRWKVRGWNLLWTTTAASPLLLARWLRPDTHGFGTHRQLGLPPCTFLWMTGFPCPFCGMTTSWTWAAHLRPLESIRTQPMGFVFFLATFLAVPALLAMTIAGTAVFRPEEAMSRIPRRGWYVIGAAVLLAWVFKIAVVRGWIAA